MKRALSFILVFAILSLSAVPTTVFTENITNDAQMFQPGRFTTLSADGYTEETVALSMTTVVGTGGTDYENAMNLLAASTLGIRRGDTTEALSLVVPDSVGSSYETPLDEWLEFLGGSSEELLLIGDVNEPAYQGVINQAGMVERIQESDFFDTASAIASQYFRFSDTVVVSYADAAPVAFSNVTTLYNEVGSLSAPTTTSTGYSTRSSNYWELTTSRSRAGGGVVAWTTGSSSVLNYQLSQLGMYYGGKFYGLDYPWYGDHKMAYPYFEGFGDQWRFNFIDMYPYDRVASFTLYVSTLDIQTYPFTIGVDELAHVDFEVVSDSTSTPIGLYVLDPDGALIMDASRFALIESEMDSATITATLAFPGPGTYTAYVTTPSNSGANYTIEMTKKVYGSELLESEIAASNGLSIASIGDSPLLFSNGDQLKPSVVSALTEIGPSRIIVVDPGSRFSASTLNSLNVFAGSVDHVTGIDGIQELISTEKGTPTSAGNVTIFDPSGSFFASAGLSAANRMGVAIPLCYQGSSMMTKAQIPEQFAWHADYTVPFIGGYHFYDYWTSSPDLSTLHPEYDLMYDVYLEFADWLNQTSRITTPESLIIIAPFNEPGETLPPAFDRAIIGDIRTGRYPSRIAESTFCQIMQSVLRVPLLSILNSPKAIDSHVAYSHGMQVYENSLSSSDVYSSDTFPSLMASAGVNCTREAGPTVPSLVADEAILWMLSSHGIAGDVLYRDDGRIVLMNVDSYRGYELGRSPSSPDRDSNELVNPPVEYQLDLNLTDFISNRDLHGLVAYIDTCQIGASYSPALMLEAGAEAVVACWIDSLFGPSDLLEQNTMQGYAESNMTLSDALVDGLMVNSHVYSRNYEGREIYNYNIISATSNQGVIFGNPDVRLLDYLSDPPRIVRRVESDIPSFVQTTLGYSVEYNVSLVDHMGYAIENDYIEYVVESPTGIVFQQGISDCPDNITTQVVLDFPEMIDPGNYTVWFSSPFSSDAISVTVEVELPTMLQSTAVEASIGGTTNITFGLLDHLGNPMPAERFECTITDPSLDLYYNASILCLDGESYELEVRFDITVEPGIYTVDFWRPGDFHTYQILINVHDNQVIGSSVLDVSIGDSINVGFGLMDYWGGPLDIDIFEYILYSPSNSTVISGVADSPDGMSGSVDLDFSLNAEIGVYQFYFGVPRAEVMYPILINLHDLVLYYDNLYTEVVATSCELHVGLKDFQGGSVMIDVLDYVLYSPTSSVVTEGSLMDVSPGYRLGIDLPVYLSQGMYVLELTISGTSRSYNVMIDVQYPTFTGPTSLSSFCGSSASLAFDFLDLGSSSVIIEQVEYVVTNPEGQVFEHGFIDRGVSGFSPINLEFNIYDSVGDYIVAITPSGALFSYTSTVSVRAPNLVVTYVNAPIRPQVGVWQIDVRILNQENVSINAQLTVILDSITIADQFVELTPGESTFRFTHDWVEFAIMNPEQIQIMVLLNYGQLTSQGASVPMTSSWQVTTIYSILPLMVAVVPVMEMYRRKTHKKLNRLTMAKEMEDAGGRSLVSAFSVYVDSDMPKSAIRTALKNDLPEDMLESLMGMGGSITYTLRTEATEHEKKGQYKNAARVFGILGQQRDQIRNELLSFQVDQDLDSLLKLAKTILERGQIDDVVNVFVQMVNEEQYDNAITLLAETDEFRVQIVNSTKSKADSLSAFKEIISRLEPGPLKYNYSLELDLWDSIIAVILEAKTAKSMSSRSNEIDQKHRPEVARLVVSQLIDQKVYRKTVTYVKHTTLTDDERGMIIQEVGSRLLSDPENTTAQKVLMGFKSLSEVAKEQVEEFMTIIQTLTEIGKGDVKDSKALLAAASLCSNDDLADKLLDRALEVELKGGPTTSLSLEKLAELTHRIRDAGYTAKEEAQASFESHLQHLERFLVDGIITEARKTLLTVNFNPEVSGAHEVWVNDLAQSLVAISSMDPIVSIRALLQASAMRSISEISNLTQRLLLSPSLHLFTLRISRDRLKMQRIARRAVKSVPTATGYRQVIDDQIAGKLIMEEAQLEWSQKAYDLWATATVRAALHIANDSMMMAISDEEKMDIVSTNLASFIRIPSKQSGQTPERIFTTLVQQANFTSVQQLVIINNSKLSGVYKERFKSLVR